MKGVRFIVCHTIDGLCADTGEGLLFHSREALFGAPLESKLEKGIDSPPLLLLYSDTHNARNAGAWVSWQATVRGFPHTLASLSTFPMDKLSSSKAVVFFVSTWFVVHLMSIILRDTTRLLLTLESYTSHTQRRGDGEFPTPSKPAWHYLLQRSLPSDFLKNTHTTVFGLGDSTYEKFNAAARKLWFVVCMYVCVCVCVQPLSSLL